MASNLDTQIGGDHYTSLGIQPFEITFQNYGLTGLEASVYTKVNKYMTRKKGDHIENLEKARHCLDILIEKAKLCADIQSEVEDTSIGVPPGFTRHNGSSENPLHPNSHVDVIFIPESGGGRCSHLAADIIDWAYIFAYRDFYT